MRLLCWVGLVSLLVIGCKSSNGSPADGGPTGAGGHGGAVGGGGSAASSGKGGQGGLTGGGGATGSAGAGAGGSGGAAGAGAAVKDCLPDCIVNLRRGCERPNADAGASCLEADDGGTQSLCFSNGVKEVRMQGDAATDLNVVFYNADGSVCYLAHSSVVESTGAQTITTTYSDPAGHVVGTLTSVGTPTGTTETATCNGTAVALPPSDPSCRMIDLGDCTAGSCP
jgi:hypothetical protein